QNWYESLYFLCYLNDIDLLLDIWAAACVMGELMLGKALFPVENGIDQLVEIIKMIGTPSREQIGAMNPAFKDHKFPHIRPRSFNKVIPSFNNHQSWC